MNTSQGVISPEKTDHTVEWKLLIFLILLMDVKLVVKISGIVLIYILQPDFQFGFRLKNTRLPLFYLMVISIAVLNFALFPVHSVNYLPVVVSGILIWIMCILAIHQLSLFVERTEISVLHNTLTVFFILNISFSLFNVIGILTHIGPRNPFEYQGLYQKYFLNTGDYIKGITADTSTTNAMINCFGAVYFLYGRKYMLVLACMAILLITASNFSNVVLLIAFAGIFVLNSSPVQKSIIVVCSMMMLIFFVKISPENSSYVTETVNNYFIRIKGHPAVPECKIPIRERPDSLLTADTRKEKTSILFLDSLERENIKKNTRLGFKGQILKLPTLPVDSIHTATFQWSKDTTLLQRQLISFMLSRLGRPYFSYSEGSPGKLHATRQSLHFLKEHKEKILTGTGIGNFSSKLAFRATGLKVAGIYPANLTYCSNDFLNNHLSIYSFFFTKNNESHSIIHSPASVYDQLLTEYGILGVVAFIIYYIGYFLRNTRKLTYGLPLLFILLSFFLIDYWFEQLSVVVLFELMMFLNIKEHTKLAINV